MGTVAPFTTYAGFISDNDRWTRFVHRPGDVVISTPPKCGTTWTQMLCALMVFDGPEFPDKLDAISPWLDVNTRSEREVFATYERQSHRRFIKTHTPLDGLPMRDDVHYVVVGRDPRDVFESWQNHRANVDRELQDQRIRNACAADGRPVPEMPAELVAPTTPVERFHAFVDAEPTTDVDVTLANVLHHLGTGWQRRAEPNVELFHFLDYQRDLVAEMQRLAQFCQFDISPERLRELAPAASLASMRGRSAELVPEVAVSDYWNDTDRFFRSGAKGEWREHFSAHDLAHYDQRAHALAPSDLVRWVHDESHDASRAAEGPRA
ncbi:MAG: sulfotransferase domain-containing protein [Actinomycetota bacterium]